MSDDILIQRYSRARIHREWEAILHQRRHIAQMERDFALDAAFLAHKGLADWVPQDAEALSTQTATPRPAPPTSPPASSPAPSPHTGST